MIGPITDPVLLAYADAVYAAVYAADAANAANAADAATAEREAQRLDLDRLLEAL